VLTRLAAQPRLPIPASRYASGERRVEAWMDSIETGTSEVLPICCAWAGAVAKVNDLPCGVVAMYICATSGCMLNAELMPFSPCWGATCRRQAVRGAAAGDTAGCQCAGDGADRGTRLRQDLRDCHSCQAVACHGTWSKQSRTVRSHRCTASILSHADSVLHRWSRTTPPLGILAGCVVQVFPQNTNLA
jgi:hypothetical protein